MEHLTVLYLSMTIFIIFSHCKILKIIIKLRTFLVESITTILNLFPLKTLTNNGGEGKISEDFVESHSVSCSLKHVQIYGEAESFEVFLCYSSISFSP